MTVDSSAAPALENGDYTDGEQYIYTTTISPAGLFHNYYFSVTTTTNTYRLPNVGVLSISYVGAVTTVTSSVSWNDTTKPASIINLYIRGTNNCGSPVILTFTGTTLNIAGDLFIEDCAQLFMNGVSALNVAGRTVVEEGSKLLLNPNLSNPGGGGWAFKKKMTINNPDSAVLTDYPVKINLTPDFSYSG